MPDVDRSRLSELIAAEQASYTERHPRSRELFDEGTNLFGRVPMTWMNKWTGGFPLYLDHARGNRISDVDGHTYVDFALGDTGAMAGHSPRATVEAVARRMGDQGGITTMLPSADAQWVGAELTRRFGMPLWRFTLSATDANRWAIRLARLATGRSKILVLRLLLPRLGRRDVRDPGSRRRGLPTGQRRSPGAAGPDDPRRDVERPGLRRARARPRRRRGDPHRAGPHQHRHRAARARLHARGCASWRRGTARCS